MIEKKKRKKKNGNSNSNDRIWMINIDKYIDKDNNHKDYKGIDGNKDKICQKKKELNRVSSFACLN